MKKTIALILASLMLMAFVVIKPQSAKAEDTDWPKRTITILVGFKAGGNVDYYSRLLAQYLEKELGVSVVVQNIAGSNGAVAARELMNADPDGYTMQWCQGVMLYQQYRGVVDDMDYLNDFITGPMLCVDNTFTVVARADAGIKTLDDLIQMAKDNPDGLSFNGSFAGLGEYVVQQIKASTGIEIEVMDTGANTSDRVTSVLNGTCNAFAVDYASVADYITKGDLIALGNCSAERAAFIPDVPTLIEQGVNADATKYYYTMWPKGTDEKIIAKVEAIMEKLAADPTFAENLAVTGGEVCFKSSVDCKAFLEDWYQSMLLLPEA